MPTDPKITLIMAVFNGASTIERAIQSVIGQTYPNIELIVIDGGSSDGTLAVLQRYQHVIHYLISEPDNGIYDAWNKGLREAHGDWIGFLGCDDYLWQSDSLEKFIHSIEQLRHSECLAYGETAIVNPNNATLYTLGKPWQIAKPKLRGIMSVPHASLFYHRSWLEKYGTFDGTYRIAGDYEMLLRGWPNEDAVFIPETIVGMSLGGISSTPDNSLKLLQEARKAQRQHNIHWPGLRFIAAFFRVLLRKLLQTILGRQLTYRLLDSGRWLVGSPRHWTKL